MKLRNILAATALVAAIGANAQGIKYVINHNPCGPQQFVCR